MVVALIVPRHCIIFHCFIPNQLILVLGFMSKRNNEILTSAPLVGKSQLPLLSYFPVAAHFGVCTQILHPNTFNISGFYLKKQEVQIMNYPKDVFNSIILLN